MISNVNDWRFSGRTSEYHVRNILQKNSKYISARIGGVVISVDLAIAMHHLFESHYQKWPPFLILPLLVALVMISFLLHFALCKDSGEASNTFIGPVNYSDINPKDAAWNISRWSSHGLFLHFPNLAMIGALTSEFILFNVVIPLARILCFSALMRHLISTGFDAQSNTNMTFCTKETRICTDMQARLYCTTV